MKKPNDHMINKEILMTELEYFFCVPTVNVLRVANTLLSIYRPEHPNRRAHFPLIILLGQPTPHFCY